MMRLYRFLLLFSSLFPSVIAYGQIPTANADNAVTDEELETTFNVTDNDTEILLQIDPASVDLDVSTLALDNTYTSPEGEWSVNASGDVTYVPTLNFSGSAQIPYNVRNNVGFVSNEALITVDVTEVNDLPGISPIGSQSTAFNAATAPIAFTVSDVETAAGTLTVTGTSDNPTLVPDANIVFAGTDADRTVTVTPVAGQSGSVTIRVIVNDGTDEAFTEFSLTVASNTPPTISAIGPQSTAQDTPIGPIPFTVGDIETPVGGLTVTASSSNPTLVADANIVLAGAGASRNLTITPSAGQSGAATITVTVDDGTDQVSTAFELTVNVANEAPTISAIGPQTTTESTATDPITFVIGDAETSASGLTLSATSSNLTLVPVANISFGGSGAARNVIITPVTGESGISSITITVSDGQSVASTIFDLTVTGNDAPTITAIGPQSTPVNTPTAPISFSVGDAESLPTSLTVSGTSSNAALVANSNISFGGSGTNRNVIITPTSGEIGSTTITITVSDGSKTASTSFQLTVLGNEAPTISAVGPQSTQESTATGPISFTIGDAETPVNSLTVSAVSSDVTLVPNANISLQGTGASRAIIVTPSASLSGTTTITLTVSDGTDGTSTSFVLTVSPINDLPTITPIANQTTAENTPTAPISFIIGDAETPASDLVVSATSSNTTIVPTGGITFDGTGSERTVTVTPAPGQSGTVNITIFVSDQIAQPVSTTFTLTVSTSNDPPTVTPIANQTVNEDEPTPGLPFTIGDPDTPIENLIVSATSSDNVVIPDANIQLFGAGISRTITITPATNQVGISMITVSVTDGVATVSTTFQVTVIEANDPPAISPIGGQTTSENTATASIPFKVTDLETAPGTLTVTATSSNVTLVPNSATNLTLGGAGEDRTIIVTPAAGQSGESTITVAVSDGVTNTSTTFNLTVTSINDAPTITAVGPQTTNEEVATAAISFTVADAETAAASLTVVGSSSNKSLVPDADIVISGTGATRSVVLTPALNEVGTTTITLTVSDGNGGTAQTTFTLTVINVNDAPLITAQVPLSTPEETPLSLTPSNFTITDPDNGPSDYSITIFQSGKYTIEGNVLTPVKDFVGELEVIVKVFDGKTSSPEFKAKIFVTDVNSPPVIRAQLANPILIEVDKPLKLDVPTSYFDIVDPDDDPFRLVVLEGDNYTLSGPDLTTINPLPGYIGALKVSVRATDGKALSEPFIADMEVFAPSISPTIIGQQPLEINEDESLVLKLEDLFVSDSDSEYPTGFTMSIQPGDTYSVNGTEITPILNRSSFIRVPVTVNDGQNLSNVYQVSIYITPVNDKPEITVLEENPITYEPGTGPIPITQTFECEDVDNQSLSFAEIGLIGSYSPLNDELIFEHSDESTIRGVYDAATGVLSLIGYAPKEDYIAAIRSVQYNYRLTLDENGEPSEISTAPKNYYITLNDGQLASDRKERSITLQTSVELDIPNAFTPNGDESNDTWAVKPVTNTDQFNETVMRVYNKRGLLVYEALGLDDEWDGTYKGESLPVDTYYYTIDLKLSFIRKTFKGSVTILR